MSSYFAGIWKCRYFWLSLVQMDLRTRYRRSMLGIGWSLVNPIAMTTIICIVFHTIFGMDIVEYGSFLLVGICFWNFMTTVTMQGCMCLFAGEPYIRQYPAPIAIYPLRVVLGGLFHFFMALVVVLVMSWAMKGFGNFPAILGLIPAVLMMFVLGWSIAVLAAFSTAYFPDTQQLSEVGLQILFYGTPIIYPAEILQKKGLGWLIEINPLASFVQLLRDPILTGKLSDASVFATAGEMVLVVFLMAVFVLSRLERKIIFQL